jgi:N-glycosylase/DNA lyase
MLKVLASSACAVLLLAIAVMYHMVVQMPPPYEASPACQLMRITLDSPQQTWHAINQAAQDGVPVVFCNTVGAALSQRWSIEYLKQHIPTLVGYVPICHW